MKLDTVRGVAMEQGRLYRLAVNKTISTAEAARLTYILREVRCSLESIPPEPVTEQTMPTLNIISIPMDNYIRDAAMKSPNLVIEHIPSEPKTPPIEATSIVDDNLPYDNGIDIKEVQPEPEPAPILETINTAPERPMMQKPGGGWVPIPPRSSLRPPRR
jgi:hypothetical protein